MKYTYEELELRLSDALQQLDVQSGRVDALAAENARITQALSFAEPWLPTCDDELTGLIQQAKQPPNTDAWVNEQRAAVWITGNEPDEFGRYWVRYDTNAGPQYCSAQWLEYNFCAGSDINIHKIWLADHSRSVNQLRGVTHYTKLPPELEAAQLRGSQV